MAAPIVQTSTSLLAAEHQDSAPLLFFYTRLHDAIRAELGTLSQSVSHLEGSAGGEQGIQVQLTHLRDRYRFLEQVYKYHSSVEDEVVYPALDSKVKNVTLAYSVEHEDEEHLLEELSTLLSNALAAAPAAAAAGRGATVRQLSRKVEQVHTTLRKHLAKEEHQLLPLLLHHFTFREQAALVAQFLCCIPLAAVAPVLTWLKRSVPLAEQASLLRQVHAAVPDHLLQQLMISWLQPSAADEAPQDGSEPGTPDAAGEFVCCGCSRSGAAAASVASDSKQACRVDRDLEDAGHALAQKPPLREILYFHQAIRSALQSFAEEARSLRAAEGSLGPAQLTALVERHRFIRAVCLFHSASEDEIVFPALRRVALRQQGGKAAAQQEGSDMAMETAVVRAASGGAPAKAETEGGRAAAAAAGGGSDRHRCQDDHIQESAQFEELGRLLGDVKSCARRGSKEVEALVGNLSAVADRQARAMSRHMSREESDVLPVLMRTLCAAEQRHMVWRILCAMPLRLLERVMPWVAGKLREEDVREWLANIEQAAPQREAALVELLSQWALRGAAAAGPQAPVCSQLGDAALLCRTDDPAAYGNETCGSTPAAHASITAAVPAAQEGAPPLKRIRTDAGAERCPAGGGDDVPMASNANPPLTQSPRLPTAAAFVSGGAANPIDHIFQFHKALRRELRELESCSVSLQAAADDADAWAPGAALDSAIQELQARFQFLRGIYRAHSRAEDEIVFPALEAKETLHNVSHAYTLDHEQEEQLLQGVAEVIQGIGGCLSGGRQLAELRSLASRLARMCAAVRASLETHVRAEEKELWPLFAEHFSAEEQEHLVGVIIGRTGAEVLHTMLSWVQGSLTQDETEAMMLSMKSASKSTAFEQWLGAALGSGEEGAAVGAGGSPGGATGPQIAGAPSFQEEQREVLAEVAQYLASCGISGGSSGSAGGGKGGAGALAPSSVPADPASIAADTARFRPGWEDIFRMNQKQLEVAVRRVSADATLEPQRKAYLIQHLMASRYIVAQQRRMATSQGSSAAATPTATTAAAAAAGAPAATPTQLKLMPPGGGAVAAQQQQPEQQQPGHSHPHHYHDTAAGVLGCRHYRRRAMLVAPCCGDEFVCRLCHDEAKADHQLDRHAVAEMVCMECGVRQAVGATCSACSAPMARYYCPICHLFDDDPHRDIYHCPFCNFCRRGKGLGVDSFHCMSCNACMSLELFNRHRCTERALGGTCPVCSDPLFHSNSPIKELPCGHFMHSLCFGAYTRYAYTCPVCAKSLGDMSVYWKMIDSLLGAEALPPEYASRRQAVGCNDCGTDTDAPFHFVYHKCGGCGGYNTRLA